MQQEHRKESPSLPAGGGGSGQASRGKSVLSFVWKDEKVGKACAKARGRKGNGTFGEW